MLSTTYKSELKKQEGSKYSVTSMLLAIDAPDLRYVLFFVCLRQISALRTFSPPYVICGGEGAALFPFETYD